MKCYTVQPSLATVNGRVFCDSIFSARRRAPSARARRPPRRAAAGREACTGVRRCRALSFPFLGVPPRATKVPYRSLAVIVAGLLAILCGYEVAAESFMTD